jgi:ACT domain-containing protein
MPKEKNKTSIRIATANSDAGKVEEALQLANAIAKVQGNIFIKELLRSKKKDDSTIRIGITKDEILDNLRTAISDGKITHADLTEWVDEVEGWGSNMCIFTTLSRS